jgi:stage V sporulation protein B
VAGETISKDYRSSSIHLFCGFVISMAISILCTIFIYCFADEIAVRFLLEERTAPLLRIIALSIPMATVHSCINGYFYGIKKAGIPAVSQLLEQLARVGCVYIVSAFSISAGKAPSISIAVLGLTIGELLSMFFSIAAILPRMPGKACGAAGRLSSTLARPFKGSQNLYGRLLQMALPLTANRIVLNLLQSVESVSIPACLRLHGYDNVTALSVYGVLTGMAMPLIFFPNALTSSVSVLLLPVISESYVLGDMAAVRKAAVRTVKYCGAMGLCCMAGFVLLGKWAGTALFHSPLAGYFITTLGFICPFLYLDTTLSSILQGLGMAGRIFTMNALCLLIRLGFIFLAVPRFGIAGYLWGLLAGQLTLAVLYLACLYRFLRKH